MNEATTMPTKQDFAALLSLAAKANLDEEWVRLRVADHGFDCREVPWQDMIFINSSWEAIYAVTSTVQEIIAVGEAAGKDAKKLDTRVAKLKKKAKKAGVTDTEVFALWGAAGCASELSPDNFKRFEELIEQRLGAKTKVLALTSNEVVEIGSKPIEIVPAPGPGQTLVVEAIDNGKVEVSQKEVEVPRTPGISIEHKQAMLSQLRYYFSQVEKQVAHYAIKREICERKLQEHNEWIGNAPTESSELRNQLYQAEQERVEYRTKISTLTAQWIRMQDGISKLESELHAEKSISGPATGIVGAN